MSDFLIADRMLDYYPQAVRDIKEFQAIVDSEGNEFDTIKTALQSVTNNAYLTTMDENRVSAWEKLLNIKPIENSTLDDRRDTIIARIRGQGKLNTELISSIVNAFTGGTAISYVVDSVLYVEITPPPNNKSFQFPNVYQELSKKVPAHLGFQVSRNYLDWREVKDGFTTWQGVKNNFTTWEEVYLYVPFTALNV